MDHSLAHEPWSAICYRLELTPPIETVSMFTHILVPLDGTPHSDRLLVHARELAVFTGATVHLLHLDVHQWIEGQDLTMEDTAASATYLDRAQHTLAAAGITVSGEALTADSRDITNAILQPRVLV